MKTKKTAAAVSSKLQLLFLLSLLLCIRCRGRCLPLATHVCMCMGDNQVFRRAVQECVGLGKGGCDVGWGGGGGSDTILSTPPLGQARAQALSHTSRILVVARGCGPLLARALYPACLDNLLHTVTRS